MTMLTAHLDGVVAEECNKNQLGLASEISGLQIQILLISWIGNSLNLMSLSFLNYKMVIINSSLTGSSWEINKVIFLQSYGCSTYTCWWMFLVIDFDLRDYSYWLIIVVGTNKHWNVWIFRRFIFPHFSCIKQERNWGLLVLWFCLFPRQTSMRRYFAININTS